MWRLWKRDGAEAGARGAGSEESGEKTKPVVLGQSEEAVAEVAGVAATEEEAVVAKGGEGTRPFSKKERWCVQCVYMSFYLSYIYSKLLLSLWVLIVSYQVPGS